MDVQVDEHSAMILTFAGAAWKARLSSRARSAICELVKPALYGRAALHRIWSLSETTPATFNASICTIASSVAVGTVPVSTIVSPDHPEVHAG